MTRSPSRAAAERAVLSARRRSRRNQWTIAVKRRLRLAPLLRRDVPGPGSRARRPKSGRSWRSRFYRKKSLDRGAPVLEDAFELPLDEQGMGDPAEDAKWKLVLDTVSHEHPVSVALESMGMDPGSIGPALLTILKLDARHPTRDDRQPTESEDHPSNPILDARPFFHPPRRRSLDPKSQPRRGDPSKIGRIGEERKHFVQRSPNPGRRLENMHRRSLSGPRGPRHLCPATRLLTVLPRPGRRRVTCPPHGACARLPADPLTPTLSPSPGRGGGPGPSSHSLAPAFRRSDPSGGGGAADGYASCGSSPNRGSVTTVWSPAGAPTTNGIALTTHPTVARSPWNPPETRS